MNHPIILGLNLVIVSKWKKSKILYNHPIVLPPLHKTIQRLFFLFLFFCLNFFTNKQCIIWKLTSSATIWYPILTSKGRPSCQSPGKKEFNQKSWNSSIFEKESGEESFLRNEFKYRKVASSKASRFVTRLVYYHTQNDNFLNWSLSRL